MKLSNVTIIPQTVNDIILSRRKSLSALIAAPLTFLFAKNTFALSNLAKLDTTNKLNSLGMDNIKINLSNLDDSTIERILTSSGLRYDFEQELPNYLQSAIRNSTMVHPTVQDQVNKLINSGICEREAATSKQNFIHAVNSKFNPRELELIADLLSTQGGQLLKNYFGFAKDQLRSERTRCARFVTTEITNIISKV
jgi:hypothetical protein